MAIGTRGPIPSGGYGSEQPAPAQEEPTSWDYIQQAWRDAIMGNAISDLDRLSLEQLDRSAEAVVTLRKEITKARNAAKLEAAEKAKKAEKGPF
jgi:hypothetical protein